MSVTESKKPPRKAAAQVPFAKKAAAQKKAASEVKKAQPQPIWLRQIRQLRARDPSLSPEQISAANQSKEPPRLLSKAEVLALVGVTFPTVWSWMRQGTFPRSRVVGGKSMWLQSEYEQWAAALPRRKLLGDTDDKVREAT